MTGAQWLWEYEALSQKEQEETERNVTVFKIIKQHVVGLLGLNLMFDEETLEKDPDLFMPWVMMGGRREIVQALTEKFNAAQNKDAIDDPEFEKLSSAIANGDVGDMDPILNVSGLDMEKIKQQVRMEDLQKAGVRLVTNIPNMPHITIDKEEMFRKARANMVDALAAKQTTQQAAQEQGKQAQGLAVLFDEDD
jgi:hypothetical protein